MFLPAQSFTPEFLTEFLWNYHRHALFLSKNYSKQGNHLLFEAQRMLYAGTFFPEFKDAAQWRKSGIDVLNHEIQIQVYPDGGQYELDPHYHLATINIFYYALNMGTVNGFRNEFPQNYIDTIERMIMFYANICFPDYSNPCFSDAVLTGKQPTINYYKSGLFYSRTIKLSVTLPQKAKKGNARIICPKDSQLRVSLYSVTPGNRMLSNGSESRPERRMALPTGQRNIRTLVQREEPVPGLRLLCFAGDEEVMRLRNWFRATAVHNTLTLDNRTIEVTESVTKLWQPEGNTQILVTENPGYKELKHRRSVFFVDNSFFVIVDEAIGKARGTVNLHYQLCEGETALDSPKMSITTALENKSNVKLQCFSTDKMKVVKEEGWYSTAYRQRSERPAIAFNIEKKMISRCATSLLSILSKTK